MIECQGSTEFNSFASGDRVDCKILKVSEENGRTWIELTRNEKHMAKLNGLDEAELSKLVMSVDQLKHSSKYEVIINSEMNIKFS
jgi:hypothetical protein